MKYSAGKGAYPTRDEVLDYLHRYEARYAPPIRRPVMVECVERANGKLLTVRTSAGDFLGRAVIGATGTWSAPFVPDVAGRDLFGGTQLHSSHYRNAAPFAGRRVLVVGEFHIPRRLVPPLEPIDPKAGRIALCSGELWRLGDLGKHTHSSHHLDVPATPARFLALFL